MLVELFIHRWVRQRQKLLFSNTPLTLEPRDGVPLVLKLRIWQATKPARYRAEHLHNLVEDLLSRHVVSPFPPLHSGEEA